jgi:hypothetical protein
MQSTHTLASEGDLGKPIGECRVGDHHGAGH